MIVVQMEDNGIERQAFVAAHRASPPDILQTIEDPMQARAYRLGFVRIARQRVRPFIRGAQGAGAAGLREVLAEGLAGPAPRAFRDRLSELDLIGARDLMHDVSRASELQVLRFLSSPRAPGE